MSPPRYCTVSYARSRAGRGSGPPGRRRGAPPEPMDAITGAKTSPVRLPSGVVVDLAWAKAAAGAPGAAVVVRVPGARAPTRGAMEGGCARGPARLSWAHVSGASCILLRGA